MFARPFFCACVPPSRYVGPAFQPVVEQASSRHALAQRGMAGYKPTLLGRGPRTYFGVSAPRAGFGPLARTLTTFISMSNQNGAPRDNAMTVSNQPNHVAGLHNA
jgi:hypothetical protein